MARIFSRRQLLLAAPGLLITQLFASCAGMGRGNSEFDVKINKKAHWSRRENWPGQEYVYGVAGLGDRYLLVKHRRQGWDFPGGPVYNESHGSKNEENEDLSYAVASYVNSQALIPQKLGESKLFAYGYAINPQTQTNYLVHWFSIGMPQTFLSEPHANMNDTTDAEWATADDPVIGKCLRMRMKEYQQAGEGGSIIKNSCFDYSI